MSPVRPPSSRVTWPSTTKSSPRLTRRTFASDKLRRSSGASNATSLVATSRAASAIPPAPSSTNPEPRSVPPFNVPVSCAMDARRPDRSMRALTPSAPIVGSSTTKAASANATKPFSSGEVMVPRAAISSVDVPSARTASVKSEMTPTLRLPFASTLIGRSPVSATVPVAANVPTEPVSENCCTCACPLARTIRDGCCCARVSP